VRAAFTIEGNKGFLEFLGSGSSVGLGFSLDLTTRASRR